MSTNTNTLTFQYHFIDWHHCGVPTPVHPLIAKTANELLDMPDDEKTVILGVMMNALYRQPIIFR